MNKILRKVLFFLMGIFLFFGIFISLRYYNSDPYGKRKEGTWLSRASLQSSILKYKELMGRYPESLKEIKAYTQGNDAFHLRSETKEYISVEEGSDEEHSVLNGEGGWYYNKETGEVKVNLTKPLKYYFEHYYMLDREAIPSEW